MSTLIRLVSSQGSQAMIVVIELKGAVMETVIERPGALDVHKEQVTACVRVPAGRRREQYIAEFKTTVQGLLALLDWLSAHGVTHVVMEASGVYWKPPWAILEDEFECMLVNARHVKQVLSAAAADLLDPGQPLGQTGRQTSVPTPLPTTSSSFPHPPT
jgi:hypothetical protein